MATNTRIGTLTNLPTGGTHDLLLFSFPDGYPEGKLEFKLEDTPRKITGIQKVAQLIIKLLMTRKGSDVLNPTIGTYFTDYTIGANRQSDVSSMQAGVISEVRDAESQAKYILNISGSDAASQLDTLTVLGLDVGPESITLYLRLVTAAGEYAQVAVPFPQLDMKLAEQ